MPYLQVVSLRENMPRRLRTSLTASEDGVLTVFKIGIVATASDIVRRSGGEESGVASSGEVEK